MINTIVRGFPSTYPDAEYPFKYLVRTYCPGTSDHYVTSVWRLNEKEYDFNWAKNKPEYAHFIKDDDKNVIMFDERNARTYLWEISTTKQSTDKKEIGELHLKVCYEIINGEYFDSEWALP